MEKTVLTYWECWSYDVWGNAQDGYEVNDRSCFDRAYPIRAKVKVYNVGTPNEFSQAEVTDYQLGKLFGTRAKLSTEGDDTVIYVTRESDGYPIGELNCISHARLSPVREVDNMDQEVEYAKSRRY